MVAATASVPQVLMYKLVLVYVTETNVDRFVYIGLYTPVLSNLMQLGSSPSLMDSKSGVFIPVQSLVLFFPQKRQLIKHGPRCLVNFVGACVVHIQILPADNGPLVIRWAE